jgi:hypothetical protein
LVSLPKIKELHFLQSFDDVVFFSSHKMPYSGAGFSQKVVLLLRLTTYSDQLLQKIMGKKLIVFPVAVWLITSL